MVKRVTYRLAVISHTWQIGNTHWLQDCYSLASLHTNVTIAIHGAPFARDMTLQLVNAMPQFGALPTNYFDLHPGHSPKIFDFWPHEVKINTAITPCPTETISLYRVWSLQTVSATAHQMQVPGPEELNALNRCVNINVAAGRNLSPLTSLPLMQIACWRAV